MAHSAKDCHHESGATQISCACHAVRLVFGVQKPRFHAECCCVDCLQKQLYAHSLGGSKVPDEVLDFERGLDLWYLDNSIMEVHGEEHLVFWKLRERASSTQCSCSRCGTILMVDHPMYLGNVVMTCSDTAKLISDTTEPSQIRWFTDDLPEDVAMPALRSGGPDVTKRNFSLRTPAVQEFIQAVALPHACATNRTHASGLSDVLGLLGRACFQFCHGIGRQQRGTTFKQLQRNSPMTVVGLAEGAAVGGGLTSGFQLVSKASRGGA